MSGSKTGEKRGGRSLEDFRAVHDKAYIIPKSIRDVLEKLGDSWVYEAEMIRMCGVSQSDFAMYRDQFKDYYVETDGSHRSRGKRVWAGTKAFAAKMREVL